MNRKDGFRFNFIYKFKKIKFWTFSFFLGLTLAAGVSFAWNAVWHGTDWVQSKKVVTPREIAENLEYLRQQINKLQVQVNNLSSSTNTNITIQDLPSGSVIAGCGYRQRCWGGANYYNYRCPSGSRRVVMYYFYSSSNRVGLFDGTQIKSFLCIKN